MDFAALRDFALALPQATEEPHFDYVSFRIKGKIFATVPPELTHTHVFVDAADVPGLTAAHAWIHELHWGKKLIGVRVDLAEADPEVVGRLLRAAWAKRAPKRLI